MQEMGALVYGLGANEPTCTPLATPLIMTLYDHVLWCVCVCVCVCHMIILD